MKTTTQASVLMTVALLIAASMLFWSHSHSTEHPADSTRLMSVQEPKTTAGISKLPIEDFEDMSLVYSTTPKR